MTQQEKELLFKDLCARLPYGVKIQVFRTSIENETLTDEVLSYLSKDGNLMEAEGEILPYVKPYLRSMSSMTEEEMLEINVLPTGKDNDLPNCSDFVWTPNPDMVDWLNAHHFDYRGLIEKGLALEALKGMYNL